MSDDAKMLLLVVVCLGAVIGLVSWFQSRREGRSGVPIQAPSEWSDVVDTGAPDASLCDVDCDSSAMSDCGSDCICSD